MGIDKWLLNEMNRRKWSQSDLARESGLSQSQISRVVSGLRPPGNEFCNAIAKAFGIPPHQVFVMAGLMPPDPE